MQDSFLSNFPLFHLDLELSAVSPSILFLTLLACKEIYDPSIITVQLMANFKGFFSHSTSKYISISHIITNLTTIFRKFFRSYYGGVVNLDLTRQLFNLRTLLNETMGPGRNKFFNSPFIQSK